MWNPDGTYKPVEVLRAMVEGAVGVDRDQEIIAYCGVGGYASAWWFVLTQVLGYSNVRIYDGAAEAWVKSDSMVSYTW
jgi:thiosulfate/3-mercaptopyruvate sulfurtransferase